MKIAVVGKGGAGKSSISWLLTKYIAQTQNVLAIDSDHNMDLIELLGYNYTSQTPNFKDSFEDMLIFLQENQKPKTRELINKGVVEKQFFLSPKDEFSKKITVNIEKNIDLAVVGLGADDVMFDGTCAHGMSNPLKIYLALLDEGDSQVVVDGVAGVDMINFGLYHACDFLVIVVEPSKNGIRVGAQIKRLCDMSGVNYGVVINKSTQNQYSQDIKEIFGPYIITHLEFDEGIFGYEYEKICDQTKSQAQKILEYSRAHQGISLVDRMSMLDKIKYGEN